MDNQIRQWLEDLGLDQYADAFIANDVDLRALGYLTDDDLKELGVSLGHRRLLLAAINALRQDGTAQARETQEPRRPHEGEVERRQLTVLFCDLVGSTELSIRLDPEDLREVLRRYQNAVTAAVARYEGHVARFLGDGVLAYFGWPRAYEDQAERAIRTGLAAAAAVEAIGFDDGERLRARIGIATGEVVVGDLIGDVSSDVEAVTGETPNLAARLQGIAQEGQVVISATTRRLVGTTFELEDLGPHRLKGFANDVSAWAVIGESAVETRFKAAHEGALTRLVGREHELGLLQERWELVKDGEGQVVLLSGEAGIGKSRMVEDFRNEIGDELHVHLAYQCSPHHTNSAFYPVIQRIQRAAEFSNEDSAEAKLDKLETLLRSTQENVAETAPIFAALLSLPAEDRFGTLDMTPPQLRYRIIEVLIDRVLAMGQQRPVLFVVEDVHWVDPSMSEYVGEIMARIVDQPIFILITYRTEFDPPWADHPHLTSIVLNRLGRKQAAEIAHSVGGQELVDAIVERIALRADGVPLFVEELTKSVLESYVSKDESTVDDLIPATLQSSLVARIDRLGDAKEIAQIGAVIGREFPHDLLAAVANKADEQVDAALDRLVHSGMVFRRGVPPDATYTFKHSLVQDAAYTTILIRRRQRLHAQIVEIVENQVSEEASERIDLLAHHAYQGGVWDKAFVYAQEAGLKAMDRAAIREAIAQFKQALDAGSHLPDTRESLERIIDLRFDLRNALWSIGAFEEILRHLDDAEGLAEKLDDPRRTGWISVYNSASLWQLGRTPEALSAANNALAINETAADLPLAVGANFYLGCAYVTSGDCRRAETYFQAVADDLQGDMSRERCGMPFVPAVISRSWLVWALAERGEFEEAAAHGEEALRIAQDVGHPFNLAHIYYDLGYFYGVKGDIDRAVDTLGQAYALVDEWKLTYLSPFIIGFLGHVTALSGRTAEGLALLQQAQAAYESLGSGLFRSLVGVQSGEVLLLEGKPADARDAADQALALAGKRDERGHEAYGLRLLGDIASHPDLFDAEAAQSHYGKALELAETFGMRPLAAHCHLGLGRLHSRNGNRQEAEQLIAKAAATYRDLGMQFWLEQSQAEA
ncbi:MAG: AAA family ATPase [Alphaproteobacteria bacterium]|nr:AAA family ATPase [Alphaproteobacteria bacterium]